MSAELLDRLEVVEDRVRLLQREVDAIRRDLRRTETPEPEQQKPAPRREPFPAAPPTPPPAPPRAAPPSPRRDVDFSALLGPKALAWAGGVVTLLGVLFFFVLAVNNGWIGPSARVAAGAIASTIVFGAGIWLRRRFGETHSSLAAVGAGIAGAYTTLAAATALYSLVSNPLALVLAAAIAGAALAVALAWRAELVAALGLVGAVAAPALLALDGGVSATGTGFAAIMTAAAAAVAVRMRWHWLLVGALVASAPQVAALVVAADRLDAGAIAVACVFACIYLAAAVGEQVAFDGDGLEELPTLFSFASIGVVWLAATQLFEDGAGAALLVAAAAFAAVSVAVWLRDERELGTLLGAIALATAAVGVADLLTGATVAYVFAAESVLLAFAARRTREPRLQLAALCYLALASLHVLAIDAPPDALFVAARHPGRGAATLAAAAVAAFAFARMTGGRWSDAGDGGLLGFLSPVVASLRSSQSELRIAATGFGVLLAIDAVSLVVLELAEAAWSDKGIDVAFDRGHLVLTVLWATAGLATVVAGTPRRVPMATALGFTWLAVTAAKVALYDALHLGGWAFAGSFLAAAAALLLAGFFREVLDDRRLGIESAASIVASALYAAASLSPVESRRDVGLGLLAIALVYAPLAAGVFARARLRDLATLLWSIGAVFAAVAAPVLLEGTWLTLAWAGGAAAFATAAVVAREQRFLAGAAAYVVLATCSALSQAPPWHLVVARQHPAEGVVDLLLVATAACVFAWAFERIRDVMLWIACGVVVYGASLGILELSIRLSDASVATGFQRGHSGVSALWGALGLTLLYVGLTRRRRALRIGGLTLFGVGLAKLFLYDLAQLSSMTRALSFLAVGAVLLLGGFFMQRLTAERGPTSTAAS